MVMLCCFGKFILKSEVLLESAVLCRVSIYIFLIGSIYYLWDRKMYKVWYIRKKINLNGIVVYNKKKRRTRRDIDEFAKTIDEQNSRNELTNG